MDYYWELIQFDGTVVMIPPSGVEVVKRRMSSGEPINTRSMIIPVNQIKSFRITDKPFTAQPLLDAAARAFNEPQLTEDGSTIAKWVKRQVTQDKWNRHYSVHPGYKFLNNEGALVTMAFRVAVHDIDVNKTAYCTPEEVQQLERA